MFNLEHLGSKKIRPLKIIMNFWNQDAFPEQGIKMKLVLRDLGVPFYDPYLIVQKTEGRMAEDDFWLKIER